MYLLTVPIARTYVPVDRAPRAYLVPLDRTHRTYLCTKCPFLVPVPPGAYYQGPH